MKCPRCGGETVRDEEDNEQLCVSDEDCKWWKDLETGEEYPPK